MHSNNPDRLLTRSGTWTRAHDSNCSVTSHTGFQFASASPLRQQFWCGNVYTIKRHATLPITSVEGRRQLRSATTGTLLLPRARTSTGQRSFAVFGPATWNSLPPSLRTPNCRWAPSSAGWRLSFSSTRELSSGAVVTDQRVRRCIQIFRLNSTVICITHYCWPPSGTHRKHFHKATWTSCDIGEWSTVVKCIIHVC